MQPERIQQYDQQPDSRDNIMNNRTIVNHIAALLGAHYKALVMCDTISEQDRCYGEAVKDIKKLLGIEERVAVREMRPFLEASTIGENVD